MRDVQRDRRDRNLNCYMRGGAERAIRMIDIAIWMGMGDLNDAADNDQSDAQKGEE